MGALTMLVKSLVNKYLKDNESKCYNSIVAKGDSFVINAVMFNDVSIFFRAEQLAIAQNIEEKTRPKISVKLQRRGSLGNTLRSSLRRSKLMFTSQDKLDDQSFSK